MDLKNSMDQSLESYALELQEKPWAKGKIMADTYPGIWSELKEETEHITKNINTQDKMGGSVGVVQTIQTLNTGHSDLPCTVKVAVVFWSPHRQE